MVEQRAVTDRPDIAVGEVLIAQLGVVIVVIVASFRAILDGRLENDRDIEPNTVLALQCCKFA